MKRLLLVGLLLSIGVTGRAETIDLYIWAGQSNAVGAAWPSPPSYLSPQADVLYHPSVMTPYAHESPSWFPLQSLHPFWPHWEGASYGSELSFGHALSRSSNNRVGIIKAAANATSLATQWTPAIRNGLYYYNARWPWCFRVK